MGPESTPTNRRRALENGALVALVGLAVLGVVGAGLAALYLNQIVDSASALRRTEPIPDYVGRPASATSSDGRAAMNVLITVADGGALDAVVLANLSADRRSLTLITVPAGLQAVAGSGNTLAASYQSDPSMFARAVEGLVTTRVDHLVQVDLDGLADVVDAIGRVRLGGQDVDGADAVAAVRSSADPSTTTAEVLRATMITAAGKPGLSSLAVPVDLIRAASHCTQVDAGLTGEVVEETLMDSSVRPSEIRLWPLATDVADDAVVPDPDGLTALAAALAEPNLPATAEYGADAFLPR